MSKFIGRLVEVGVGLESSRGVAVVPAMWIPKTDFSFDDKVDRVRSVAGLGKLADSEEAFVVTKYGAGDMTMYLRSQTIGYFLYSMFGSLSTSGPTDNAYTHAFSISEDNQHESLTLYVKDKNNTEAYKLAVVDSLEFLASLDEPVTVNVSFLSRKGNVWASQTPSYTDEYMFTKKHVKVKVAADIASLGAASALSLKSARLTISQNPVRQDVLGTAEPEDILNQQLSVEGELVLDYESSTWKDYFTGGTDRAMEVKFVNEDEVVGGGSTNPSLTIQMPKVDFNAWDPGYPLDELAIQTISFKGSYDLANSQNIISTCDLVNAKTSY